MPAVHTRRIRTALYIAAAALTVPLALTLHELQQGGVRPWVRLGSLAAIAGTLALLLSRQGAFERQIAEQQRTSNALRESEAKFSGILAIAADAIITVDQAQKIVHFNAGAEHIFGYQAKEVIGRHLALLLPSRYRVIHDKHMEMFARSPEGARRMGERREIFGLRADGTEFPAEASISKLIAPDGILFTVVLRDITERKRAEEDERFLAEASATFAASLDVPTATQAIADLAVPRLADAAFVDVLGPGESLQRVVGTRQRESLTNALNALGRHGLTWDSPFPAIDVLRRRRPEVVPDVTTEWLHGYEEERAHAAWRELDARALIIVPLVAADHMLGALTLISTDEQRTSTADRVALAMKFAGVAAATLENAQLYTAAQRANRSREEVLSVVSHDLRNPLSAILMCARALEQSDPSDPAARQSLVTTIRESAAWSNRLIQDLLDVASIEQNRLSLERETADPAGLVLQARHMFDMEAGEHRISLEQEVPTNLPVVDVDGARIVQVLGNLMRNALKFTADGGRITVGVRSERDRLVFYVRDTGVGISPDKLARVFDRYWQSAEGARARGTGLGLSIAKGIVEAHGGHIWVESKPNAGSTFYFSLPTTSPQAHGD
jgi:PAS domain S-box-containing protein